MKESIVLLSGLLCDETIWFDVANELKDSSITYLISFKGCDSIESMAKRVLDNTPETFYLLGHSMGGRVALEIMKQAPHRVKKLALFNTGVHGVSQKEIEGREKFISTAKNEGIEVLMKQWLPPMMSESGLNNKALMSKLERMVLSYNNEEYLKQIKALINRPDALSILSSIKVPTLLLSGTQDKWSPISQHKEIQKHISNSQLVALEGAGHMAPAEFPKEISKVIKNWLFN